MERPDYPKMLGDSAALCDRLSQIYKSHVEPLNRFVESLRVEMGPAAAIPYFDPWDGGVSARLLLLLEAPGPKAVNTGFVSRNNPDETAKNIFELSLEADIPRTTSIAWNIIPWYIGTGKKIRAANTTDIASAASALKTLLSLLPKLEIVMLLGKKAQKARHLIYELRPSLELISSPHPSPLFVNRRPENRARLVEIFKDVSVKLSINQAAL